MHKLTIKMMDVLPLKLYLQLALVTCFVSTCYSYKTRNKNYTPDRFLNGRICPSEDWVMSLKTGSLIYCMLLCDEMKDCTSVFYNINNGHCYGCIEYGYIPGMLDEEHGTVFFYGPCITDDPPYRWCHMGSSGRVRLCDGRPGHCHYYHGRVEVEKDGIWGTICDVGWTVKTGVVLCSEFPRKLPFLRSWEKLPITSPTYTPIWMESPPCVGNEDIIHDCPGVCWNCTTTQCLHVHDVVLLCHNS